MDEPTQCRQCIGRRGWGGVGKLAAPGWMALLLRLIGLCGAGGRYFRLGAVPGGDGRAVAAADTR